MTPELLSLVMPAVTVMILVTVTLVPLGQVVLERGIIFIDLAVAQVASLGLVAVMFMHVHNPIWAQLITLALAFTSAVIFRLIEQSYRQYLEAFIGVIYVFSATLALFLLSYHPQGAEHFESLLSGELLFVDWQKILMHLPIYILVIGLWHGWPEVRKGLLFYLVFALLITSAVQLIGVFMVFAVLICPALVVSIKAWPIRRGYILTLVAFTIGMSGSLLLDAPTTPAIVLSLVIVCFSLIFATSNKA